MFTKNNKGYRLFILTGFLLMCIVAPAQKKLGLEPNKWANILSTAEFNEVNSIGSLTMQLVKTDSLKAFRFLDSLESSNNAKGYVFRTYFNMVKADVLYLKFAGYDKYKDRGAKSLQPIKEQIMKLFAEAIDAVYHTDNDLRIGWVSFYSARRMKNFGETAMAVMYSKNGVDLFEKVAYPVEPPVYTDLAELLYHVREYDESIGYAKKGIAAWKKLNYEKEYKDPYKYKIKALNIIGKSFYKKNQIDSANTYYRQALLLATNNNDKLLVGNVLGNIGIILYEQNKFDTARSFFQTDYENSKDDSIYNDAANALQWMARTNIGNGNKTVALAEAREAIQLLRLWPDRTYLRDTYYTLSKIFRALGNYDSAFYYNDRFTQLHDSLEKVVSISSLEISKARLNDKTSRYNIQNLNEAKRIQILTRNIIIVIIILLSAFTLLVINRKQLQTKMAMEKAEQENKLMEQEITAAKKQMRMFTENIVEKTALIEKLEYQKQDVQNSVERQGLINELSNQTILTEDDWINFKTTFEKIHPGFFRKLKEKVAEITIAEQRMASLTKLNLTTRQIASMLGISVDSVHKTRQRLRQRIHADSNTGIDDFLAGL